MPVRGELIDEMEHRTQLFKDVRADHLADYCRKAETRLPRIVVACDEFADLVMASKLSLWLASSNELRLSLF